MKLFPLFFILSTCFSFTPHIKPPISSIKNNYKPNVDFLYYGDYEPMNYFDPLKLTTHRSSDTIKFVREAELQHCRVAMSSFVILSFLDLVYKDTSVTWLSKLDFTHQSPFWFIMTTFEILRMTIGWKNPFVNKSFFLLEDYYQPGNILKLDTKSISPDLYNKELANGRLAMFGCLGYIAEELVTNVKIFDFNM